MTKANENNTQEASSVQLQRLVRRWWIVECRRLDHIHEIGGNHATLEKARWYLENCLAKDNRRKYCVIVRHEETAIAEAPNVKDHSPIGAVGASKPESDSAAPIG